MQVESANSVERGDCDVAARLEAFDLPGHLQLGTPTAPLLDDGGTVPRYLAGFIPR
jgi:hypothetical protein